MSKILAAYFSASGVTAKKAQRLANAADADLFEIRRLPYMGYPRSLNALNCIQKAAEA